MAEKPNMITLNLGGRPRSYHPKYARRVLKYIKYADDNNKLPSIAGLSLFLNCSRQTIYKWKGENEDFAEAVEFLMAVQEQTLLDKGLTGEWNTSISRLVLGTNHNYNDKIGAMLASDTDADVTTFVIYKPSKDRLESGGGEDGEIEQIDSEVIEKEKDK